MATQLKIDQVGLSAGVAGRSRTDGLDTGAVVSLTNTGSGTTTLFRLLWAPPGDTTAVESLAVTGDPKVWTFTPTEAVYGSYMVELVEDEDLVTEVREQRVIVVRTPNRGLVIPALNERGDPSASLAVAGSAQIAAAINNASDYEDATLNTLPYAAYWRALHELISVVDAISGGGEPTPTTPLSNVRYVDLNTSAPEPDQNGSVGSPFSTIQAAIDDLAPVGGVIYAVPGNYMAETLLTFPADATYIVANCNLDQNMPSLISNDNLIVALPEVTTASLGSLSLVLHGCTTWSPLFASNLRSHSCGYLSVLTVDSHVAFDTSFENGAQTLSSSTCTYDRCLATNFNLICSAGSAISLMNCEFSGAPTVVFSDVAGILNLDSRSNYFWEIQGGALTNGTLVLQALDGATTLPDGSYDGQPVKWNGSAYVPIGLEEALTLRAITAGILPDSGGDEQIALSAAGSSMKLQSGIVSGRAAGFEVFSAGSIALMTAADDVMSLTESGFRVSTPNASSIETVGTNQLTRGGGSQLVLLDDAGVSLFALADISMQASNVLVTADTSISLSCTEIGFLGAVPVARPSIIGDENVQTTIDSLIAALVSLGLVTDDR